jgi:hypothetical protein
VALAAHAAGIYSLEAAVRLLIGHRRWLERADFLAACVLVDLAPGGAVTAAFIDWPALIEALYAGDLPCSGGERRVLSVALSLAEGVPVDLREALCGLDRQALALVAECVAHAGGGRDAVLTVGAAQ